MTTPFDDKLHEECGVFGVFGHEDAGALTALGLHALQHRGQEAAGIVTFDGTQFISERHVGLVGDIFGKHGHTQNLRGANAIGHVRYSTTGSSIVRNVQPMFADLSGGGLAIAHNGNLTNARSLRRDLVREGAIFQSTSDTEAIIHLAARSHYEFVVEKLIDALKRVEGAYSLVALTSKKLIGVRDSYGVRPLVLGKLDDAWILSSETCALDIIGADFVRDIEPGEMVVITVDGIESLHPFPPKPRRFCVFEYVYFARPDSVVEGKNVYEVRKRIGMELAREAPADADIVIPIPDSGVPAALGYAAASGLPFELGIIRNHYVGRTFIEPTDHVRHLGVKLKHNANREELQGKRIVLVDDSIVRGTTSQKIVEMVRDAGASEVHFRIASPPTTHSCFMASIRRTKKTCLPISSILKACGTSSKRIHLAFVSIGGLYRAVGEAKRNAGLPQFCDACFSGDYPIEPADAGEFRRQLSLLSEVV